MSIYTVHIYIYIYLCGCVYKGQLVKVGHCFRKDIVKLNGRF